MFKRPSEVTRNLLKATNARAPESKSGENEVNCLQF